MTSTLNLKKLDNFSSRDGPLVLIIMDGVGLGEKNDTNAFHLANTPYLDKLQIECPKKRMYATLRAHGTAVGLPTDNEMGNSEVGHNAFGAGTIPKQRATLAKEAILQKSLFNTQKWINFTSHLKNNKKVLHLIGLLSDGYVHSHISHLIGLLNGAKDSGIQKVRVHPLLDGRDVPPQSALKYVDQLEEAMKKINLEGNDYRIASGGGRMRVTMDRYNSDWDVVQRGWEAHVYGIPEIFPSYKGYFESATAAIKKIRELDPEIIDQYLPSFVIIDKNKDAIGKMEDGDGVIYFNFRGDRAIQISRAFDDEVFSDFERVYRPKVDYYGLLKYDEKADIPKKFFIEPPKIDVTLSHYLNANSISQLALAETYKFGHVQYFWEGNKDFRTNSITKIKNEQKIIYYESEFKEDYIEVVSFPSVEIEDNPMLKASFVKEEFLNALNSNKYKFLRVNFANGDMVGHTGNIDASIIAVETVDKIVQEITHNVNRLGGVTIVTADHGNLEDMSERWKTSHTLNPVMLSIIDKNNKDEYIVKKENNHFCLGNVAGTILNLLGFEIPSNFLPSLIEFK